MTSMLLSAILLCGGLAVGDQAEFQPPTRFMADGVPVRVDNPGWACPCWADMDGDGKKDLLVGQFNGGKIRVYKNLGDGKLAAGDWLKADGAVAEIPGVW
jgi:FG-GAP-like repeat